MRFTLETYMKLLKKIKDKRYIFVDYKNWMEVDKSVILRHDIDFSLKDAMKMSEVERGVTNVAATYFVLVSSNFYNIHSRESRNYIKYIMKNGGNIGLHFDETQYPITNENEMKAYVQKEAEVLGDVVGSEIDVVSMHRPSREFLTANMTFPKIINSYNEIYFKEMKYLSDSRRYWRENVDEIIEQSMNNRLHILTHPFWYAEGAEADLKQTLKSKILKSSLEFYDHMYDNFQDLQNEVERTEIERIVF